MTDKIYAYKAKLCEALETCMAEPVSARSVGNCCMLMDALCKADKLTMTDKNQTFTEADAKRWTEHMENDDGSTGPHWTLEQATAVANSIGVHTDARRAHARKSRIARRGRKRRGRAKTQTI